MAVKINNFMDRNSLIIAINDLYDENMSLKIEVESLLEQLDKKNKLSKDSCNINKNDTKETTLKLVDYAKKKLIKDCISDWYNEINVSRDEESKEIKVTNYDTWLDRKIKNSNIPNNMSIDEVKNIIYEYARKNYEEEKKESIKKFEDNELKEKLEEENKDE